MPVAEPAAALGDRGDAEPARGEVGALAVVGPGLHVVAESLVVEGPARDHGGSPHQVAVLVPAVGGTAVTCRRVLGADGVVEDPAGDAGSVHVGVAGDPRGNQAAGARSKAGNGVAVDVVVDARPA